MCGALARFEASIGFRRLFATALECSPWPGGAQSRSRTPTDAGIASTSSRTPPTTPHTCSSSRRSRNTQWDGPKVTLATVFEVVTGGKIYRVAGPRVSSADRRAPPVVEPAERIPGLEAAGAGIEGRLLPPGHMSMVGRYTSSRREADFPVLIRRRFVERRSRPTSGWRPSGAFFYP